MPDFVNPFSGKIPDRKLTLSELIRALRLNLAAEHAPKDEENCCSGRKNNSRSMDVPR